METLARAEGGREGDRTPLPVDGRVVLLQPRHAQDQWVLAEAADEEVVVLVVLTDLQAAGGGEADRAGLDGPAVDDSEGKRLGEIVQGEVVVVGEIGVNKIRCCA